MVRIFKIKWNGSDSNFIWSQRNDLMIKIYKGDTSDNFIILFSKSNICVKQVFIKSDHQFFERIKALFEFTQRNRLNNFLNEFFFDETWKSTINKKFEDFPG